MPVLHASPRSRSRRVSLQFLFPFLTSGSLPPSFPTNLPQVCPISGSRPSHIHLRSGLLARLRSPRRSGAVVFSPVFPVASLPFLSSGSFHLSSTVSPLPFRQVRSFPFLLSDSGSPSSFRIPVPLPPFGFRFSFLLSDSGSTTPSLGFGSVARGLRRSAPHTTPLKRQLWSVRGRGLNVSLNEVLWTGNRGWGC